jgi:hypothetical protein
VEIEVQRDGDGACSLMACAGMLGRLNLSLINDADSAKLQYIYLVT